ncbi:MAG: type II secretion system protein M [Verrucomicrobia bacterium]|nr:type II secretion system protein M [Verrucomicrobiota bacterium]MCF7708564.1 type II secretion system protein M [Verrucomicrobiota bacterium]
MTSYFDKLNLKPSERRLVVITGIVVFLILNIWFVWPNFGNLEKAKNELKEVKQKLENSRREVSKLQDYQEKLMVLEGMGAAVLPAEQARQLTRTVQTQAQRSDVTLNQITPLNIRDNSSSTNEFFEEQAIRINVTAAEEGLIDFLYQLGSGDSMIRVRNIDLRPDSSRTQLTGTMILIASYQKNVPAATGAARQNNSDTSQNKKT